MEHIHTKVDDPLDLRKKILESAINATEALKADNDFIKFYNDGNLFMNQFRDSIKQVHNELDRLKDILPPLPDEFKRTEEKSKRSFESIQTPKRDIPQKREMTQFDQELRELRAKISKLMLNR